MRLEVQTVILMLLVGVLALWLDSRRHRPSMRQVDKQIFGGAS